MANEADEKVTPEASGEENPRVEVPGEQNPREEVEDGGFEGTPQSPNDELSQAQDHVAELEQLLASKDSEIASLKQTWAELEERLAAMSRSLGEAISSYKTMLLLANPEVPEELVAGDTVASINESLNKAKTLIYKIRQGLEAEVSLSKFPAGAPERTPPDLSTLSPREKIQYAIGGKR